MSDKVRVVLNSAGIREFLRSPEMAAMCRGRAEEAVDRLGGDYKVSVYKGKNRVNASIYTDSAEAFQENLDSNSVLKALR